MVAAVAALTLGLLCGASPSAEVRNYVVLGSVSDMPWECLQTSRMCPELAREQFP